MDNEMEVDEKPGLEKAVPESVSPVIDLLNEHFSRMKLKGNQVKYVLLPLKMILWTILSQCTSLIVVSRWVI